MNLRADYFTVELRGSGITAVRDVYSYREAPALVDMLARIAAHMRPWSDTERWEFLEGELSLAAVCLPLGQVAFSITVSELLGGPEDWPVSASSSGSCRPLPPTRGPFLVAARMPDSPWPLIPALVNQVEETMQDLRKLPG